MSFYHRKISYIHLYDNGERLGNIGHVKTEFREGIWNLEVFVEKLSRVDSAVCEMKTLENEAYLDRFPLEKGSGLFRKAYSEQDLWDKNIQYGEVRGLLFQFSSHRYGKCMWNPPVTEPGKRERERKGRIEEGELKASQLDEKLLEGEADTENRLPWKTVSEETLSKEILSKEGKPEENRMKEQELQEEYTLPQCESNQIAVDKWEQLCRMYPAIHPFQKNVPGEYLSLCPKDFVILTEKYQALVNNSFLLHGYFNYRHIILGKLKERQGFQYYIGVPGTYHEREKMVAVMFGFEKFQGVEMEKPGAFGYYMKEVRI